MKKIKLYISLIASVIMLLVIIIRPQYVENVTKALISIMECQQCFSE